MCHTARGDDRGYFDLDSNSPLSLFPGRVLSKLRSQENALSAVVTARVTSIQFLGDASVVTGTRNVRLVRTPTLATIPNRQRLSRTIEHWCGVVKTSVTSLITYWFDSGRGGGLPRCPWGQLRLSPIPKVRSLSLNPSHVTGRPSGVAVRASA